MSTEYPVYNNKRIDQWKVTELKEELRKRKLKVNGLKEDLVRRLYESLCSEMEAAAEEDAGKGSDTDGDPKNDISEKDLKQPPVESNLLEEQIKNVDAAIPMAVADTDDEPKNVKEMDSEQSLPENNVAHDEDQTMKADAATATAMVNVDDSLLVVNQDSKGSDQNKTSVTMDAALKDKSDDAVPIHSVAENQNVSTQLQSDSLKASYDENTEDSMPVAEVVTAEDTIKDAVPVDSLTEDQNAVGHLQLDNQGATNNEEPKDAKSSDDLESTLPDTGNQASEVSSDSAFQVNRESISTDSGSINEKNVELKDNLNANNVNLELEVVKRDMVEPLSSDMPTAGVDLNPLGDDKEMADNQVSLKEFGGAVSTMEVEDHKKIDSLAEESPEKLNLDRSSGDESMEEDVFDSTQIDSKNDTTELAKRSEDKKTEVVKVMNPDGAMIGGSLSEISEDGIKPTALVEKRKAEGQEAIVKNEPKRRRWNSETIKAPESQASNLAATVPKDIFQPSLRRSFTKSEPSPIEEAPKERVVPPPKRAATTSLRIDNFLRPFTLKAVQELLGKTGTYSDFWMDHIKTHCYLTYSSVEEAIATRNALYNLQWPTNGGRLLVAEFVDPQEVKSCLEAPPQPSASVTPTAPAPAHPQNAAPPRQLQRQQILPPPPPLPSAQPSALNNPAPVRERLPPPPSVQKKPEPEPPIVTLDDLFKKTRATPRIYYLPLSEEQVAAKLAAQGKRA